MRDYPKTVDLLDAVKVKIQREKQTETPTSNYMLAKILGISETAVHRYYKHGTSMSDDIGLKVARELDYPPETVLSCLRLEQIERQESDELASAWRNILKEQIAKIPIFIALAATSSFAVILGAGSHSILCQIGQIAQISPLAGC